MNAGQCNRCTRAPGQHALPVSPDGHTDGTDSITLTSDMGGYYNECKTTITIHMLLHTKKKHSPFHHFHQRENIPRLERSGQCLQSLYDPVKYM